MAQLVHHEIAHQSEDQGHGDNEYDLPRPPNRLDGHGDMIPWKDKDRGMGQFDPKQFGKSPGLID